MTREFFRFKRWLRSYFVLSLPVICKGGFFLLCLLTPVGVMAQSPPYCWPEEVSAVIPYPEGAEQYQVIGSWIEINIGMCPSIFPSGSFSRTAWREVDLYNYNSSGMSVSVDGKSYPLYLNLNDPSFGYILAKTSSYLPMGIEGHDASFTTQVTTTWPENARIWIRFVRVSAGTPVLTTNWVQPVVEYLRRRYRLPSPGTGPDPWVDEYILYVRTKIIYSFTLIPTPTCNTPTIPAQVLSPHTAGHFVEVGSTGDQAVFLMEFTGCKNHSKVRYKVESLSGSSPNADLGLLPLIPPSTASGMAVQVQHRRSDQPAFKPLKLNSWNDVKISANSIVEHMSVRYYRTGAVTPGSVHAAMTITFQYQ